MKYYIGEMHEDPSLMLLLLFLGLLSFHPHELITVPDEAHLVWLTA